MNDFDDIIMNTDDTVSMMGRFARTISKATSVMDEAYDYIDDQAQLEEDRAISFVLSGGNPLLAHFMEKGIERFGTKIKETVLTFKDKAKTYRQYKRNLQRQKDDLKKQKKSQEKINEEIEQEKAELEELMESDLDLETFGKAPKSVKRTPAKKTVVTRKPAKTTTSSKTKMPTGAEIRIIKDPETISSVYEFKYGNINSTLVGQNRMIRESLYVHVDKLENFKHFNTLKPKYNKFKLGDFLANMLQRISTQLTSINESLSKSALKPEEDIMGTAAESVKRLDISPLYVRANRIKRTIPGMKLPKSEKGFVSSSELQGSLLTQLLQHLYWISRDIQGAFGGKKPNLIQYTAEGFVTGIQASLLEGGPLKFLTSAFAGIQTLTRLFKGAWGMLSKVTSPLFSVWRGKTELTYAKEVGDISKLSPLEAISRINLHTYNKLSMLYELNLRIAESQYGITGPKRMTTKMSPLTKFATASMMAGGLLSGAGGLLGSGILQAVGMAGFVLPAGITSLYGGIFKKFSSVLSMLGIPLGFIPGIGGALSGVTGAGAGALGGLGAALAGVSTMTGMTAAGLTTLLYVIAKDRKDQLKSPWFKRMFSGHGEGMEELEGPKGFFASLKRDLTYFFKGGKETIKAKETFAKVGDQRRMVLLQYHSLVQLSYIKQILWQMANKIFKPDDVYKLHMPKNHWKDYGTAIGAYDRDILIERAGAVSAAVKGFQYLSGAAGSGVKGLLTSVLMSSVIMGGLSTVSPGLATGVGALAMIPMITGALSLVGKTKFGAAIKKATSKAKTWIADKWKGIKDKLPSKGLAVAGVLGGIAVAGIINIVKSKMSSVMRDAIGVEFTGVGSKILTVFGGAAAAIGIMTKNPMNALYIFGTGVILSGLLTIWKAGKEFIGLIKDTWGPKLMPLLDWAYSFLPGLKKKKAEQRLESIPSMIHQQQIGRSRASSLIKLRPEAWSTIKQNESALNIFKQASMLYGAGGASQNVGEKLMMNLLTKPELIDESIIYQKLLKSAAIAVKKDPSTESSFGKTVSEYFKAGKGANWKLMQSSTSYDDWIFFRARILASLGFKPNEIADFMLYAKKDLGSMVGHGNDISFLRTLTAEQLNSLSMSSLVNYIQALSPERISNIKSLTSIQELTGTGMAPAGTGFKIPVIKTPTTYSGETYGPYPFNKNWMVTPAIGDVGSRNASLNEKKKEQLEYETKQQKTAQMQAEYIGHMFPAMQKAFSTLGGLIVQQNSTTQQLVNSGGDGKNDRGADLRQHFENTPTMGRYMRSEY